MMHQKTRHNSLSMVMLHCVHYIHSHNLNSYNSDLSLGAETIYTFCYSLFYTVATVQKFCDYSIIARSRYLQTKRISIVHTDTNWHPTIPALIVFLIASQYHSVQFNLRLNIWMVNWNRVSGQSLFRTTHFYEQWKNICEFRLGV